MDLFLSTILKYAIGILGVGIIVLLHEVGHFIAARIFNIDVEIFSIGFGPKMISKQKGKTEFRISWILFGGYCRMKGADDLTRALDHDIHKFNHVESGSLFSVHPFAKFLTYLAGPITNFLLTILLCTLLFTTPHQQISIETVVSPTSNYPILFDNATSPASNIITQGDKILQLNNEEILDWAEFKEKLSKNEDQVINLLIERNNELLTIDIIGEKTDNDTYRYGLTYIIDTKISLVRLFSPEYRAGLKKGDVIIGVNEQKVLNNLDLLSYFKQIKKGNINLKVERNNKLLDISYTPERNKDGSIKNNFSLTAPEKTIEGLPLDVAFHNGYYMATKLFSDTIMSIKGLISRNSNDIRTVFTGPMRASLMIGNITVLGFENNVSSGLRAFLYLLAIVSISLTIANIIPIPAFDGGQMLIALFETITKKRLSPKNYWRSQIFGLVCVLILFSFMYFVDIKYFLSMI